MINPAAFLLRTERPVLLEREWETHTWYATHDVEREFGVLLIYDHAPGDWIHYSEVFHQVWKRAGAQSASFINSESDVVPTEQSFRQVLECPEPVCTVPNQIWGYNNGELLGHSAWVENRVPGGWESHFVNPPEDRAKIGDLGFVRFGPAATAFPIDEVPRLDKNTGLLNQALFEWLNVKFRTDRVIHLHWPALKNHHVYWDAGDDAHHV